MACLIEGIYFLKQQQKGDAMSKIRMTSGYTKTDARQMHLTLQEVADALNLTKERVRQIEAKALLNLRKKLQAKGIKPSDLLGS
jgi:DNA-directed RNA polymerase sigma subunit (sigma70/sigma32)